MCNEQSRHIHPCPDPLYASPEEIEAYEVRLKHVLDEDATVREAELREQEAREEGRVKGRKEGQQAEKEIMVHKLLQTGMDAKEIDKITEIGEQRILEIEREKRT